MEATVIKETRPRLWWWREAAAATAVISFFALTVYTAAVDLDFIAQPNHEGDTTLGEDALSVVNLVGWLAALIASIASLRRPDAIRLVWRILLPLGLAALFVAGYYSYDWYCDHCRVSDMSGVSEWVVILPVIFAIVTAATTPVAPRIAMAMTVFCLLMIPVAEVIIGPWH